MPIAIVLALAASLGIHAAALFGTDVELFGGATEEPVALRAELQPPPSVPPPAAPKPVAKPKPKGKPVPLASARPSPAAPAVPPAPAKPDVPLPADVVTEKPATPPAEPVKPLLPASGVIRFAILMGSQGFPVGRAEHRWEFTEDGHYHLYGMTETSGLVALFKTLRFENESHGKLVAGGLQPERYVTRKNGKDANENADFDWPAAQVQLSRDGQVRPVAPGTQDILSLNYHLAYLRQPESGASVGVVTGKKYERYALDSLGEEEVETPAGRFRTLHLRAMTDSVTEIWLALDHHRLPVKIRFTDKKGDVFEQIATELGTP
ncbi:DUF3108 domain-containing protein [uncultured Dechloromonas sp.]|uniref:DUF3108 domain-containing protein n=1 Tax=uncultured Dechloromonas sp. TaxID=171719 RepID=UPI0025CDBCDE|nr:DUF3108 domain-containing protein [uncultured Dechloromonas sp.]